MYRVYNGKIDIEFSSYEYLVNWVSQFNEKSGTEVHNSFLEQAGVNEDDMYRTYTHDREGAYGLYKAVYMHRQNRIIDENGNNLYSKKFVKEVKAHVYSFITAEKRLAELVESEKGRRDKRSWNFNGWRWGRPERAYPDFRSGPIPFIGKHGRHRVLKNIKTTNEKRQTCTEEHKIFNRGTRGKHLPDAWDEKVRDWKNTGWKNQGKKKHQWENGVITREHHRHGKGVYVEKPVNIEARDEFDDE